MESSFPWNGLRHLGDSGNGGMTLEFLSPFLWRAPRLEMCRERRVFFPKHTGKGSLLSSYEADAGLLRMCAECSCFLSSGDGYVGELLELPQGCEGPFGSSRGYIHLPRHASAEIGLISPGGENLLDFSSCRRCSRLTTGTSATRSGGLRKG